MPWGAAAVLGAGVLASEASKDATAAASAGSSLSASQVKKAAKQARTDVNRLSTSAQGDLLSGASGAFDIIGGGIGEQQRLLSAGNVGAQQTLGQGFSNIQAALLGTPIDQTAFAPQGVPLSQAPVNPIGETSGGGRIAGGLFSDLNVQADIEAAQGNDFNALNAKRRLAGQGLSFEGIEITPDQQEFQQTRLDMERIRLLVKRVGSDKGGSSDFAISQAAGFLSELGIDNNVSRLLNRVETGKGGKKDVKRAIEALAKLGFTQAHIPGHIPPTGLIGSEQAIQQGLGSQLGLLAQGIGSAQGEIDVATGRALAPLSPFAQQGQQASQIQAVQSGALGPEAQQQAFQQFNNSPGQQFAIDQGRQNILRSAAATQGTGGGNVLRELNRQGIGQAQQFFQQGFNNLGQVANRGFNAAGAQSGIQERGGQNLSNLALQGGVLPAQAVGNAAGQLSQGRFITGQQLAQAAGGISAGQANLQNQLGQGLSNQFGQGSTNLANLVSGTGQQSAQLQQNLATILANIGTGSASQAAGFTSAAAQFDASGILGQNTAVQNTLSQLLQLIPQGGGGSINSSFGANSDPFGIGSASI